jgi:hypothetical protein
MLLSEIEKWDVGALNSIATELNSELSAAKHAAGELEKLAKLPGWDSPAAEIARERIKTARTNVLDDAAVIGAVQQLAEETALAVTTLQNQLGEIQAEVAASNGHLSLSDSGEVTISGTPKEVDDLQDKADDIETRAKALIHQADDIDADGKEVFDNIAEGKVTAAGATDFESARHAGEQQSGLSAPYPPEGNAATPADVSAWWRALSADEQRKVIAEHPDWIANRDGVPVTVRSGLNITALDQQIAAAAAELDSMPTLEEYGRDFPQLSDSEVALAYGLKQQPIKDRLTDLNGIKSALSKNNDIGLGYDPDKYLMMFHPGQGYHDALAAIAVGNPDTADHVSVTTPGMNTHPTSLSSMVSEATAQRGLAQNLLDQSAEHRGETVSTIAWFGYDPPDVDDVTIFGALSDARAEAGAVDLGNFYRGINATNENGSGVHLSAFGHSYGSLTTAQALQGLGETGVVDDAVFYGSPGLGYTDRVYVDQGGGAYPFVGHVPIRDEADLFLPEGHGFVMQAPTDPIAQLGSFGGLPQTADLEVLSTEATVITNPDGSQTTYEAATAHADYPRPGSDNHTPRVTGYNLAVVTAGLGDEPGRLAK